MTLMKHQISAPTKVPSFANSLEYLVSIAKKGHRRESKFFNPDNQWLVNQMRVFQDSSDREQSEVLEQARKIDEESKYLNGQGKAGTKVWPDIAVRLETGGLGFFSQCGVARRPDLTQYYVDGFQPNRDAISFSESNQELFAQIIPYITDKMEKSFGEGQYIIQTDRQIGDTEDRSFHARQLLFGTNYPQLPYMWRQLTFEVREDQLDQEPQILEVSIPNWLTDLGLPDDIKQQVASAGLTQLIFKAPTLGLSLHLGFDYMGEHKMGPLSIAMFMVKQSYGLALQAALSMARVRTIEGKFTNAAMVTTGPSLHGKSTLTIMIELAKSQLFKELDLKVDPEEGVYPMNDDIILLQKLKAPITFNKTDTTITVPYAIDGTENNMYAVPFGLSKESDPITYDVLRGTEEQPNHLEILENVPFDHNAGSPNFFNNPVRNMRMILSRTGLLARKGVNHLSGLFTNGALDETVHVPMENMDRILWQGVMRQNTVVPPLVKLNAETYVRALMYGEAVQTGASVGAIGKPYVEYFSDPFIIGLEDENANALHSILSDMAKGGLPQEYYMFNTGGIGADNNEEASGSRYKKIDRQLTLLLQEAVLRQAVEFERDEVLGVDVAVAIVDAEGKDIVDLREEWLPRSIYGEDDYRTRVTALKHKRFYGDSTNDKAGILRYTKVSNKIFDISEIPIPIDERELSWLLSFYYQLSQAYETLSEVLAHVEEGIAPEAGVFYSIEEMYRESVNLGLEISREGKGKLRELGFSGG